MEGMGFHRKGVLWHKFKKTYLGGGAERVGLGGKGGLTNERPRTNHVI